MAFQVYLTDGINLAELDTEDIDVQSTFSIQDITDISTKKDSIKSLTFKGTKTNNHVFGTYFDLGRTSDFGLGSNLYFNYNPLRSITCMVFEASELVFKGSLRLSEIKIDKNGQVIYSTVLTGPVIDFKTSIQDRYLHDLDLTDLTHRYNMSQIQNSWATSTERYDSITSGFTTADFAYGSGYVYPYIDYGYRLSGVTGTSATNNINSLNMKPAVYVTEYLDRIFSQDCLSGYSYEIKGDTGFTQMFNQLIIPDSQEGVVNYLSGITSTYSLTGTGYTHTVANNNWLKLIPLQQIVHPVSGIDNLFSHYSTYKDVLLSLRKFKTVFNINLNLTSRNYRYNSSHEVITCKIEFVTRTPENNNTPTSNWATVASKEFTLDSALGLYSRVINFDFEAQIEANRQYAIRVFIPNWLMGVPGPLGGNIRYISYTANTCQLTAPKNVNTVLSNELTQIGYNERIKPSAPVNVKQIDFIRSLMNTFNLYCYSNNTNTKHLIFERYDEYYVYTNPAYISSLALDWSGKVDYSKGIQQISNLNLPKSYLFTYKDDEDYLTKYYKERFSMPYGSFTFDDSYGLIEQKKVELIFSPLVITTPNGTDRKYPLLYKVDGNEIKKTKTNIRLGIYNGLQECTQYTLYNSDMLPVYVGTTYPQVSNYYLSGSTAIRNIQFGRPNETYFGLTDDYISAPTGYENYFINQVSDLTNPDVTFLECYVLLNTTDISSLDLRIPIYIDTGRFGAAYFKLIKLEYQGKDQPSKVSLQKIAL